MTPREGGTAQTSGAPRTTLVRVVVALLVAWAALLGAGLPAGAVTLHHAGLVVRGAAGGLTYAYVAFPEESISGLDLLKRTGLPLVTVGFGGLGEAVCQIGPDGCPIAECQRNLCQSGGEDAPYWQYFRQQAGQGWKPLVLGASATRVRDGDVDGWSWSGGEAMLPPLTLEEIARLAGAGEEASAPVEGVPTAAVRAAPSAGNGPAPEPTAGWATYAAAAGVLAAIGAAGLVLARRGRAGGVGP